ncbi:DUF3662 and FHA domain-containing protein [Corynebacterium genitalium ATCC 33030]|uniref:FHA domain protein n=1 Tax=Corynebacterium genitalium ATCC 33030 TaxID=585529 RepID=D7WBP6_9CORY|nr:MULTISPECIES: DUF3662 and FHA domain-containing protein [Corynebacterium]EFK55277.1 FHA domain protein [Corynebacterium genitalium ATCC 33030]MCQ4624417.1 DUF3662 and FHA domain-containing protein [Corynebacterium sp. CCUG 69979]MCQ4626939.1 DUF3662 and FHA domain-containing protein [Corynebacterium sp. CCUG 65737]UUA89468.1 DUF3662 and FHA domain-containing protein [Corynebacterium genitalium ATCC 33030]
MALMDRLAKIDSSLQRGLDNGFAAVFGGRVVPAELEELLKQEAQDELVANEVDEIVAPNVFAIGVSSKDLENLSQDPDLPAHLAGQLTRFVRNLNWGLYGPVVVRVAEESGLRTGQLRVSSYIDEAPDVDSGFDAILADRAPRKADDQEAPMFQPQPAPNGPAVTLLLLDGSSRTYQVHEGSNILGRSNDADFRLPDTGVSRQHAEVIWDGQTAFLVDLQSTNGTTVNDQLVENWELADGDVITVGHSSIEVRIVGPRYSQPAQPNEHYQQYQ